MGKTASNMTELGATAPDFSLIDVVTDTKVGLHDGQRHLGTVVVFICNHCPFVVHIQDALVKLANTYIPLGIRFLAISSNDVENFPDDSPEKMKIMANAHRYPFPYLYDETQDVAKAYQAACTPDLFVFDSALACVYRGQFDASTPGNKLPATGNRLSASLDCLLQDVDIDIPQHPSVGCNIKWKE